MFEQQRIEAECGEAERAEASRPVWRAPALFQIDMVRTMLGVGSRADGPSLTLG